MEIHQPMLPKIDNIRLLNGIDILTLTDVGKGDIAIVNGRERYINITGKNDNKDDWLQLLITKDEIKDFFSIDHDINNIDIFRTLQNLNTTSIDSLNQRYLQMKIAKCKNQWFRQHRNSLKTISFASALELISIFPVCRLPFGDSQQTRNKLLFIRLTDSLLYKYEQYKKV